MPGLVPGFSVSGQRVSAKVAQALVSAMLFWHGGYMPAYGSAKPTAPRMQLADARKRDALAMRLKGYDYAAIGDALGVTSEAARHAVKRGMAEIRTEAAETAVEVREQEAARLDRMLQTLERVQARAEEGGDTDTLLAVQDRMIRVQDRRARLMGLDLHRVEVTGQNGGPIQIAQIQRVIVDAPTTIDVTPRLEAPREEPVARHDDMPQESSADSSTYSDAKDAAPIVR